MWIYHLFQKDIGYKEYKIKRKGNSRHLTSALLSATISRILLVPFRTQITFPFPCGLIDFMPLAQGLKASIFAVNSPMIEATHLPVPTCFICLLYATRLTMVPLPHPCSFTRAEQSSLAISSFEKHWLKHQKPSWAWQFTHFIVESKTPSKLSSEQGTRSVRTKKCGCCLQGADNRRAEIRHIHGKLIMSASILNIKSGTGIRAIIVQGKEMSLLVGWSKKASGSSGTWPALEDEGEVRDHHLGNHIMSKGSEAWESRGVSLFSRQQITTRSWRGDVIRPVRGMAETRRVAPVGCPHGSLRRGSGSHSSL